MSRLLCENCHHGYGVTRTECPWCGTPSTHAHTSHQHSAFDIETYPNYWLCMFRTGETFQMFDGHPLDIPGLRRTLSRYRCVSFNGIGYDMPIIALALQGKSTYELKAASDAIIVDQVKHWDIAQPLEWVEHVDMMSVKPGEGGLKMLAGKMHSKRMQDLPFDPSMSIEWYHRVILRAYCRNDLDNTEDLYQTFPTQLKLREEMSAEYGVDLMSKSDAQIAETVMKKLLPFAPVKPYIPPGTTFHYRPPEWLKFLILDVDAQMARFPFVITPTGGVSPSIDNHLVDWGDDQLRLDAHGNFIKRPAGWEYKTIRIGNTEYALGIGGLHSKEANVSYRADDDYALHSPDVAAYYPSLIVRTGIAPAQIGPIFQEIYGGWKRRRDAAKVAGDKKTANSLKTLNNGTFGKLGSKWSIFYAPSEMIQVTVTGQLALLMLVEMFETCGIAVISANTDGVVVRCKHSMKWMYDNIISWWEGVTGMVMETTDFSVLACRDVNAYIGITASGDVKLKGAFAPPEPGASGWPNPTGQICVDAVVAYIKHGTPLEDTIRACRDIRQFVHVRAVKGGGSFQPNGTIPKKTTMKDMREVLGVTGMTKIELETLYGAHRDALLANGEYLGKAVRWYYADGSHGCITYASNGNLVAKSEGCRPCMMLPDELPDDIDYKWYVDESRSMLRDIAIDDTGNSV